MNHKELVLAVAGKMNMQASQVESFIDTTVEVLKSQMLDGNTITFHGFGSFELKRKEERLSVHPATGARTMIPPKQVVNFKQSTTLKSKLKDIQHNG